MKESNTANRLKEIMSERNIKQIDILNACLPYCKTYDVKMSKSDISQYVSGKVEPGQDKLFVLGNALNVSEAWLMGFNVPKDRNPIPVNPSVSPLKLTIISYFDQLNSIGQETATEQVRLLTLDKKYTEKVIQTFPAKLRESHPMLSKTEAAHARTDIRQTIDGQQHDNNIMNNDSEWE